METTNIAKYVQKKYSIWKEISENINWIQCHTFVGHLELLCNKYSRKEKKVILWSRTYETRIVETEIQMVYFTIMSIFVLLKIAIIEFEFIDYLYLNFSPSSLHQSELFTFFKTQFKFPSPSKSFLWSYHPKVASLLCYFPLEMLLVEQFEIHFPRSYFIMGSGLLSCPQKFCSAHP